MRVEHLEALNREGWVCPAVTIGNFDGVHRGHQALIAAAVGHARATGGESVAVTFDPHPARILSPERAPSSLMTLDQRAEMMGALRIDHVVALRFDRHLAQMAPPAFCSEVLRRSLGAQAVVVGESFRFGRGRSGDVSTLRALGADLGFAVEAVPPVLSEGRAISSSRVREALSEGDVSRAAALLGRRFFLDGRIVAGDGRGRTIGVPTANLDSPNETLPALGVYACWTRIEGEAWRPAVVNVGRRPTFGGGAPVVEAHLLDWQGNLYGRGVRLEFEAHLRDERRFESTEELLRRIQQDVVLARGILEKAARTRYSP
jgi:riboflavin kinase / FMN adenylyltransferase